MHRCWALTSMAMPWSKPVRTWRPRRLQTASPSATNPFRNWSPMSVHLYRKPPQTPPQQTHRDAPHLENYQRSTIDNGQHGNHLKYTETFPILPFLFRYFRCFNPPLGTLRRLTLQEPSTPNSQLSTFNSHPSPPFSATRPSSRKPCCRPMPAVHRRATLRHCPFLFS